MKSKAMWFWIIFTSALLLFNGVASQLGISYSWLLSLTLFGSTLLIGLVYKVLTDDYQPKENFDDWFEENIAKTNELEQDH